MRFRTAFSVSLGAGFGGGDIAPPFEAAAGGNGECGPESLPKKGRENRSVVNASLQFGQENRTVRIRTNVGVGRPRLTRTEGEDGLTDASIGVLRRDVASCLPQRKEQLAIH